MASTTCRCFRVCLFVNFHESAQVLIKVLEVYFFISDLYKKFRLKWVEKASDLVFHS